MPDRTGHTEFKVVEVYIPPSEGEEFADPKTSASVQQSKRSFPNTEFAEQELNFGQIENLRNALSLCALPDELDWIPIRPFVSHSVRKKRFRILARVPFAPCSLDAVWPLLHGYRLHLVQRMVPPTRKYPVLQIALVGRSADRVENA